MAKRELLRIKNLLLALFRAKNLKLDRIIFFGSQIANKADKESDIDIIAVSRNFRGKTSLGKLKWPMA